ncbi:MAG: transposase [Planctomycetes bacterium]|nr:transposase [Planctomycetota bacterium]
MAPTLAADDVVVWCNLNAHNVAGVREGIEAVGARLLHLPPYSADFNPIEQAFAKFKRLVRSAAERTVEGLWSRCGHAVERFPEYECRHYSCTQDTDKLK